MDDNTITDGEVAAAQSKTKPKTRSAATRKDATKSKASPRKQTAKSADSGLADYASSMATTAARTVRRQAESVAGPVRRNPGRAMSAVGAIGILGFFLGVLVGRMTAEDTRRRWY
ncbi:hypothetical protein SAMN05428967_3744 [Phyllobacterium sp. YR620]|uniref:hypothetical protein n=1 Tax=Phyllobacterium sp. YR620 TaxID=1881066 RepID=UPI00087FD9B3|nr:hypothetical protein [Phyllobacterium sp. YR620]SDP84122.1 hypothetical protein SAMN05428967_3744 [Phyllobacterium sp. YR620]